MSIQVHTIPTGPGQAHLVQTGSSFLLVDAGLPGHEQKILNRIGSLGGGDLRLILITHAHLDHYGSAAALRRLTGAPIAIHAADAEHMAQGRTQLGVARGRGRLAKALLPFAEWVLKPEPVEPDVLLRDGDVLGEYGPEVAVVHTPGHTVGSSTLLIEAEIAFAGDLVLTNGQPHVQRLYAQNWPRLAESLRRLQGMKPKWVFCGHGRLPLSGEALQRLSCEAYP
jgi:glyoxylase-like metal-dependent hydrolase (beta-lactamase superfamily II)